MPIGTLGFHKRAPLLSVCFRHRIIWHDVTLLYSYVCTINVSIIGMRLISYQKELQLK